MLIKEYFGSVDVIFESNSGCLVQKGKTKNISTNILIPDTISAPVTKGQKIGEINYCIDGEIISTVNIVAKEDVKKLNLVNMSVSVIEDWFTLFR